MPLVRVSIATSLDGFIAGSDGDLSWLPQPAEGSDDDFGWAEFIASIGCLLMGRTTFDSIISMGIPWPHTERPTIVATSRPLANAPAGVTSCIGPIGDLIELAKMRAGTEDVYLDGGNLIRQALDQSLVDEITITLCPIVLGAGIPLFAGSASRHPLRLEKHAVLTGGLVQLNYVRA